ncbi:hypothetical protein PJE062_3953 [Pseudovibrio sp. JE062]|nr:hypothetical protein PJE062_3953 [Pseudovibrio sp. JE062]
MYGIGFQPIFGRHLRVSNDLSVWRSVDPVYSVIMSKIVFSVLRLKRRIDPRNIVQPLLRLGSIISVKMHSGSSQQVTGSKKRILEEFGVFNGLVKLSKEEIKVLFHGYAICKQQ